MSDLRTAAQQALEALEYAGMDVGKFNRVNAACTALRAALAQEQAGPERVQEPGFWGRVAARQASRIKELESTGKQALEFIRHMNREGWMLADYEGDMEQVVAGLEAALAEPVQEPVAWLRVIDEAMVTHHLGIADPADDYETAKSKMTSLLCLAQDIGAYFATPPQRKESSNE